MYECGQRLSTEAATQESLKQQLKCYLACINCLKLLPKDAAWILKPTPMLADSEEGNTQVPAGTTLCLFFIFSVA